MATKRDVQEAARQAERHAARGALLASATYCGAYLPHGSGCGDHNGINVSASARALVRYLTDNAPGDERGTWLVISDILCAEPQDDRSEAGAHAISRAIVRLRALQPAGARAFDVFQARNPEPASGEA